MELASTRLGGRCELARCEACGRRFGGLAKLGGLEAEMRSGFTRVGEELNDAKIRDEELHGLLKFSLEAREGLRESMEQRFDVTGNRTTTRSSSLLKDVLRHVTGTRA